MRALKAERTGVRGWAAALKVEQASVEHQLAGRGAEAEAGAEQADAGWAKAVRACEAGQRVMGHAGGRKEGEEAAGPSVGGGRAGRRGRCAGLGRQQWARWSRLG